jgi:hypothetical protein
MKKTLLEVAHEMAAGLYEAGVIDTDQMREYESVCAPPACKLSHVPNAKTIAAMKATDKGEGLTEVTLDQLSELFSNKKKSKYRKRNKS